MLVLVAILAGVSASLVGGLCWAWAYWLKPPCLLRECTVNTTDPNLYYQAVVWSTRGPWVTLRDVTVFYGDKKRRLDGETIVHRDKITSFQVGGMALL